MDFPSHKTIYKSCRLLILCSILCLVSLCRCFSEIEKLKSETLLSQKSEKLEAKEDLFIASVLHTKAVITAVNWITNCITELSSKWFITLENCWHLYRHTSMRDGSANILSILNMGWPTTDLISAGVLMPSQYENHPYSHAPKVFFLIFVWTLAQTQDYMHPFGVT